jgi:hypothetical protein
VVLRSRARQRRRRRREQTAAAPARGQSAAATPSIRGTVSRFGASAQCFREQFGCDFRWASRHAAFGATTQTIRAPCQGFFASGLRRIASRIRTCFAWCCWNSVLAPSDFLISSKILPLRFRWQGFGPGRRRAGPAHHPARQRE